MLQDSLGVVARHSLVVIAVILVGAALRSLGGVLTPLLLAMFLAVMVDGLTRELTHRVRGLSTGLATILAVSLATAIFISVVLVLANRASGFFATVSAAQPRIIRLFTSTARALQLSQPDAAVRMALSLDPTTYLGGVALALQGFLSEALFVLVYLGFLIASKRAFERKAVKLFAGRDARQNALRVFGKVRDAVERYLWIQTITGLLISVVSWAVMAAVRLDNAMFWAFLVFVVNYVPFVGAIVAIVLPALFALVQFDSYWPAAVVLGGLWLVTFVVGNIILPRMQGDSLNIDPLAVLLSLAFWGALWGLPGMFLSTPLTVLAMLILAQFQGSRWLAILISADGEPDRAVKR